MIRKKRIIFDIGHPAQVHMFKHVYRNLEKKGWKCLYIAKKKDFSIYLLEKYKLNYITLSKSKKGFLNKVINLPLDTFKYFFLLLKFRPGILLNRFSIQSTFMAKLLGIPIIGFTDTEHAINMDRISSPLIKSKLTSTSYVHDLGNNHFRFNGNIELFYLHKKRFTPDNSIKQELGVKENEKYVIIRFVSWDSHHDVGLGGFSIDYKRELVNRLNKFAKVFISSEDQLPDDLMPYRVTFPAEKMHDVIAGASLLFGESATMASEAAVLGTPAIYHDEVGRGYTDDEEKYGLVFNYSLTEEDQSMSVKKAEKILKTEDLEFEKLHKKFLEDKIDVTSFVVWFVENYPESIDVLKYDSEYQFEFK